MSTRARKHELAAAAAEADAFEDASGSDSDPEGPEDDVALLSEASNDGGGAAHDFPDQIEFGAGASGGHGLPSQAEFGAGGGGGNAFPSKSAGGYLDEGAQDLLLLKLSLRKFVSEVQEYEADAITDHGVHLQVYGSSQSKLKALPERAQLLHDVLKEIAIDDPILIKHLTDLKFTTKEIKAAAKSVKMLLVVRNAVDEGRLQALTQERSRKPAVSKEDPVAAPTSPPGTATSISIRFQNPDKDAHKDRVNHPPGGPYPANVVQTVKDAMIAISNGFPSKAEELFAVGVRKLDTRGVAHHYLFSILKSLACAVTDGVCTFGSPSSGDTAGLTYTITNGSSASSDLDVIHPLTATHSREERLAADTAVVNDLLAGRRTVPGSVREGNNLIVHLGAQSHRILNTRALVQQTLATILVKVVPEIQFHDSMEYEAIMNIVHTYEEALKGANIASNLATATELGGPLTPLTVVLSKAVGPYTNIATNMVLELWRATTDPLSVRYVSDISRFATLLPKPGESAHDFLRKVETLREDLKSLQKPEHVNFEAIGFAIDPLTQLPVILSSPAMNIMKVVDHCYSTCVKADVNCRTRDVMNAAFFKLAREGKVTKAQLLAALTQLQDMKIPTSCKTLRDETKQQRPVGQVNAFAAVPTAPAPGGKGSKGGAKPQPQERGRPPERQHESSSETTRPRSRSPSQQHSTVATYKKCIDAVKKHGLLKYLQRIQKECEAINEPLFEVDQAGDIVLPIKLLSPHSWGKFSGKLGVGGNIDSGLFAGLMLTRDICRDGKLSKTGSQHCSDNDSTWTKQKAIELRGDLTIAGAIASQNGEKSKGKAKGAFAAFIDEK